MPQDPKTPVPPKATPKDDPPPKPTPAKDDPQPTAPTPPVESPEEEQKRIREAALNLFCDDPDSFLSLLGRVGQIGNHGRVDWKGGGHSKIAYLKPGTLVLERK